MPLQPLDADQFWEVDINWTKPVAYKDIIEAGQCDHDGSAQLYHILGRYTEKSYKSFYIGHTYTQCVSVRLKQPDHRSRYAALVKNHPRHLLFISCGIITITNGKKTRKRVKDIETILIYTNRSEHSHNVRNVYGHGVIGSYRIQNHGYRYSLPRELHLGFFVR